MDEHRTSRSVVERWSPTSRPEPGLMDRRAWLRIAAGASAGLAGAGLAAGPGRAPEDAKAAGAAEADDLRRAEARARQVTTRPLLTFKSAHYQAIGDATEAFLKLTLSDCEKMAADYIDHFRSKEFDVKLPARRLTVIVFRNEGPFRRFAVSVPPGTMGFYSLATNWLSLFDTRNEPMKTNSAGQSNMETLTHEATHQLTFNTGLLDRQADTPRSIMEGLAMYCERRRLFGHSEPGQPNLRRLDELAHIRRRVPWIDVAELLTDDRACFRRTLDRMVLSYCESWLLVYHLMTDKTRLPQFRSYLEVIRPRKTPSQRLEDARAHFLDLARLDGELRQEAIRLQQVL
jgi:Protein of unknown function (DUF1570)